MKKRIIKIIMSSFCLLLFFGISIPKTQAFHDYDYEYIGQSDYPTIYKGDSTILWLTVKNTGSATWDKNIVHLGTSNPNDRPSEFYLDDPRSKWISDNRIIMDQDLVYPGDEVSFGFWITAPSSISNGLHKEYFTPVADGFKWMKDIGIYWEISVRGDTSSRPITEEDVLGRVEIGSPQDDRPVYSNDKKQFYVYTYNSEGRAMENDAEKNINTQWSTEGVTGSFNINNSHIGYVTFFPDPVTSTTIGKMNVKVTYMGQSVTDSVEIIVLPPLPESYSDLVEASRTCTPASSVLVIDPIDFFGIMISGESFLEIRGEDSEGNCMIYIEDTSAQIEFSQELIDSKLENGMTLEEIEAERKDLEDEAKTNLNSQTCSFSSNKELTDRLADWAQGNFSSSDFDNTTCIVD